VSRSYVHNLFSIDDTDVTDMNYIAKENDVKDTVYDFMKFCDFIEREKPFATSKGDLSTKACYEVNKLLRYPQTDAKTTDRM